MSTESTDKRRSTRFPQPAARGFARLSIEGKLHDVEIRDFSAGGYCVCARTPIDGLIPGLVGRLITEAGPQTICVAHTRLQSDQQILGLCRLDHASDVTDVDENCQICRGPAARPRRLATAAAIPYLISGAFCAAITGLLLFSASGTQTAGSVRQIVTVIELDPKEFANSPQRVERVVRTVAPRRSDSLTSQLFDSVFAVTPIDPEQAANAVGNVSVATIDQAEDAIDSAASAQAAAIAQVASHFTWSEAARSQWSQLSSGVQSRLSVLLVEWENGEGERLAQTGASNRVTNSWDGFLVTLEYTARRWAIESIEPEVPGDRTDGTTAVSNRGPNIFANVVR